MISFIFIIHLIFRFMKFISLRRLNICCAVCSSPSPTLKVFVCMLQFLQEITFLLSLLSIVLHARSALAGAKRRLVYIYFIYYLLHTLTIAEPPGGGGIKMSQYCLYRYGLVFGVWSFLAKNYT